MLSPRERCLHEIAAIEAEVRAGNVDLPGLLLALRDWRTELWIINHERTPSNAYVPAMFNSRLPEATEI